jgi:hypothetical protein
VSLPNFTKDLTRGATGEQDIHMLFPSLERLDGRTADFKTAAGDLVEVKTDFYPFEKTNNFFIERYSHGDAPGGVHQALAKGAKYFVYLYNSNGAFYIFRTDLLVRFLDWRFADAELITVRNETYNTRGYKIPRSALAHLVVSPEALL